MTSNARIQSVFAKAILDVRFLEKLTEEKTIPGAEEKTAVPLPAESIRSLRLFSAFIAKVQHNYLWNDFPLTLTTIRRLGIELEIFGAYLPAHQQNRRDHPGMTIEEKKNCFVEFFRHYTSQKKDPAFIKAHTILTHENIYRQAKKITPEPALKKKPAPGRIVTKSIPVYNGRVWINELYVNPALINTLLTAERPIKVYQRKKRYCYWQKDRNEDLRVFEVSKNMAAVLAAIDGKKNIGELNALTGYSAIETGKGQKEIIKALAGAGIVSCI